jgi:hypothetical protein
MESRATPAPTARRLTAGAVALVVVAALLPYLNAFGNEFVRDDEVVIRDNLRLRSLAGLAEALTSNYWGDVVADASWRPLVTASWAGNHALTGLWTPAFKTVDLALHAGVCLALASLALSWGASRAAALATAVLFAVHPVHTEAVTGFVGRADTLAALFVLLALLAHRRAAGRGPAARLVTAAAVLAALLSKESAVAVLALIPLMDVVAPAAGADGRPVGWRARLRRDYPLLALAAVVWLAARWSVLGSLGRDPSTILPGFNPLVPLRETPLGDLRGATPLQALLTPLALLAESARLLAWPARLSLDYSFDQLPLASHPADPRVLIGSGLLTAGLVVFLLCRRRAPIVSLSLALFGVPWLITGNLLFPIGTLFAERLLYLPSAGALLLVGLAVGRLGRLRPVWGALVVVVVLAAVRTWTRNPDFRDADAVTAAMVRDAPRSFLSHYARGMHLHLNPAAPGSEGPEEGRAGRVIDHLQTSVAIYPEYDPANRALVVAAWAAGRPADTLPAYERLSRLAPDEARVLQGWASALIELAALRSGADRGALLEQAGRHLDRAVALDPDDGDVRFTRGMLLADRPDRSAEAREDLQAVLRLAPGHPQRAMVEAALARLGDR